jgi:uncharacterized protein (DUF2384 family)
MASLHGPEPATAEQLLEELAHPSAGQIWNRALEIFGDREKARSWMQTPRDIFAGRTPEELLQSGDQSAQRRVLEVLIRIDYGVFS